MTYLSDIGCLEIHGASLKTLEKIIAKNQGTLTSDKIETFNSAVDHRLAELTMNKLYDKVPASVWKYVK
ncbi:hemolysin activation protein [Salmonella enterica subsp. enterica]|nr:hemolysin activation protein [Salmonella enterica subsp. enterica]